MRCMIVVMLPTLSVVPNLGLAAKVAVAVSLAVCEVLFVVLFVLLYFYLLPGVCPGGHLQTIVVCLPGLLRVRYFP